LSNIITKETGQNPKSRCHLFNIKRGVGKNHGILFDDDDGRFLACEDCGKVRV
jgi:hypothetical protein